MTSLALDTRNNFLTELDVRYVSGSWLTTKWRVLSEFTYRIGHENADEHICVPSGFITDFASIPIGARLIFRSPGGAWDKPSVIHDYLYKFACYYLRDDTRVPVTRERADDIFKEAMEATHTNEFAKAAIYRAVRIGGQKAWNQHRKAEADAARAA